MYLEVSSTVPTVVMSHFGITQGAESAIYLQPNIPQLGTFALLSTAPAELGGARIRPSGLQQVCESAAANLPASTAVLMQPTGESRFLHVFWRRCCFGRWVPFPLAPTACPSGWPDVAARASICTRRTPTALLEAHIRPQTCFGFRV